MNELELAWCCWLIYGREEERKEKKIKIKRRENKLVELRLTMIIILPVHYIY